MMDVAASATASSGSTVRSFKFPSLEFFGPSHKFRTKIDNVGCDLAAFVERKETEAKS